MVKVRKLHMGRVLNRAPEEIKASHTVYAFGKIFRTFCPRRQPPGTASLEGLLCQTSLTQEALCECQLCSQRVGVEGGDIFPGTMELQREEVDLLEIARTAVGGFTHAVSSHPVHFDGDCGVILGDPTRLRCLVLNLLAIAAGSSPDGSEIKVDVWRRGSNVCLFVEDNAPSAPAMHRKRSYLHFAAKAEREMAEMSVLSARRLAEIHGATLGIQEIRGRGTIYEVRFRAHRRL